MIFPNLEKYRNNICPRSPLLLYLPGSVESNCHATNLSHYWDKRAQAPVKKFKI